MAGNAFVAPDNLHLMFQAIPPVTGRRSAKLKHLLVLGNCPDMIVPEDKELIFSVNNGKIEIRWDDK